MKHPNLYGTTETNGLANARKYHEAREPHGGNVYWNDPQLSRITRLRLLSDPGFPVWDVSYCHGILEDGTHVDVDLPFDQLPKRRVRAAICHYAVKDKVFAKGLGIYDAISTLC